MYYDNKIFSCIKRTDVLEFIVATLNVKLSFLQILLVDKDYNISLKKCQGV